MASCQIFEFKTLNKTTLRGCLYPAEQRGAAVVLCPGFNCVKEMMGVPDVAEHLQRLGITALTFDPRTTGKSDGQPRNEIDPFKQIEDLSDALSFLSNLPSVDPGKMGFWDFHFDPKKRPTVLTKCIQDRESQALGNAPFYLPMVMGNGENPVGFGNLDKARYAKIVNAGKDIAPGHANRTTIQTYYKMFLWQPFSLWQHISPTPVLFVIPELDIVSPAGTQLQYFNGLTGPKRLHVELGIGHEEVLVGEHLPAQMRLQAAFINDVISGKIV